MQKNDLFELVKKLGKEGFPIMGACAGLIILSKEVIGATLEQKILKFLDIKVNRNAYER